MARYIDADDFQKTMIKRFGCVPCLTDYSEASRNDIPIDDALDLTTTAEVVPKSEVAREIFVEIENIFTERIAFYEEMKKRSLLFHEITYAETMITNLTIYLQDIVELKKKYTEGEE